MAGKKAAPEVHKFGGASLGDAEAFRHAVGIMQKRTAPRAVVVSALAGITDALLGLANRAVSGGDDNLERDAQTLRARYRSILDAVCPKGEARDQVGKVIDQSLEELVGLLNSLTFLRELTARTSDLVVSRGERLSAQLFVAALAGSGVKARYVDALEVVFTDGPFGGASPNLNLTDAAARKVLRPLIDAGIVPVVPGFLGAAPRSDDDADRKQPAGVATLGRGGSDL
ncbi:MAG TPA: hypothetical protein VGL59_23785, partial [Polyangia bacterium]